jgi:hypothetical protein
MKELVIEAEKYAVEAASSEILPTHIHLARIKIMKKYKG